MQYHGLYRGVSAKFYGGHAGLEYDLMAPPGSAYRDGRLGIRGGEGIRLDRRGDLVLRARGHQLVMYRPKIYQMDGTRRIAVAGGYRVTSGDTIGFVVGKHRADLPIVIDPSISITYSTFLGGNGAEQGSSVAVDSAGNVYAGGTTTLPAFPEAATGSEGPLDGTSNLFVAKIDPTQTGASSLVYLTFIGGSKDDQGGMVAADDSATRASVAVLGWTTSPDFPATDGSTLDGASDLTVTKLNAAGNGFIYSKYFGGSGAEATQNASGIARHHVDGLAHDVVGAERFPSDIRRRGQRWIPRRVCFAIRRAALFHVLWHQRDGGKRERCHRRE
ncbi:MAG TPA: SBBP repeat-containing protein [Candidatus Limnocylindrales bacterium]|nr:SBBP repeat-containing protein [Candidatus Limnocylindrales bacterium]